MDDIRDDTPMPWGEHKGTPMGEVPGPYLLWLLGHSWLAISWPSLFAYLQGRRQELEAFKSEESQDEATSYEDYLRDTYGR